MADRSADNSTSGRGDGFPGAFDAEDDLDRAMVLALAPDALLEQVKLRRDDGTHRQSDAALELLDGYGRLRSPADIARLLALLPAYPGRRADRTIVIQAAALARPAGESAQVAAFLAEGGSKTADVVGPESAAPRPSAAAIADADELCGVAAALRAPRDLARFVLCLAAAAQTKLAEEIVVRACESRCMQTVAVLELALRAHGAADLASRAIVVALDRNSQAAEITALIDYQLSYGPTLAEDAAVSEPMNTHIRERMPEDELVDLVLRQYARDPGRALAWSAEVAGTAARPVSTVVRLLARASSSRYTDLAEKIIATVATYRQAEDLVTFIDCSARHATDVFDDVLSRVSAQAGIETISNVVQLYNARKAADAQLFRVLADNASAETLIGVGAHLAARGWHNLTDELLQAALEYPERYTGAETAGLLAGISRRTSTGRWHHGNITRDVVRRLQNRFSPSGDTAVDIPYFAELTCAAARLMDEPRAAQVRAQVGERIFSADDRLSVQYVAALRTLGRHDLAEEFHRATWGVLDAPRVPPQPPRRDASDADENPPTV